MAKPKKVAVPRPTWDDVKVSYVTTVNVKFTIPHGDWLIFWAFFAAYEEPREGSEWDSDKPDVLVVNASLTETEYDRLKAFWGKYIDYANADHYVATGTKGGFVPERKPS